MNDFNRTTLHRALEATGRHLDWNGEVEILVVGGAAGMVTGLFPPERMTADCDVVRVVPKDASAAMGKAATAAAKELNLSADWLSEQVQQLDVLPDGWRRRRKQVGKFGNLVVYAAGRRDLLAMKVYANRPQDRADILSMGLKPDDIAFVRQYLTMMKVPSRQANLDQVVAAEKLLDALEAEHDKPS
jgi:hypothetical protein